jgi:hypothetical protein
MIEADVRISLAKVLIGQFADFQKKSFNVCFLECQIKSRSNYKTERSNPDFYTLIDMGGFT